jgi:prolyl oligopeptidase
MKNTTKATRSRFLPRTLLAALALPLVPTLLACSAAAPPAAAPVAGAEAPAAAPAATGPGESVDPYLWLEDVDGERALAWVREQNEATYRRLEGNELFDGLYRDALAVLDSASRLPQVTQRGRWLYNLWKDADHPRGIYRRTTLAELRKPNPDWQVVLDIDALAASEGKPWVFHGFTCLPPAHRKCLVSLSPGGTDADEVREFDAETLQFVEDGFSLPLAKSSVSWRDADTLYVGTDFGEGTLTTSGYPRIVKLWRRGTPLSAATTLFEGGSGSVSVSAYRLRSDAGDIDMVRDQLTTWTGVDYHLTWKAGSAGELEVPELHRLALPQSALVEDIFRARLVVSLKKDWVRGDTTLQEGSVLVADPRSLWSDGGAVEVLFAPDGNEVVEDVRAVEQGVLVSVLDSVRGRLYRYEPAAGGAWTRTAVAFPDNGALGVMTVDDESGDFFVAFESFVTPPTLYHVPSASLRPEVIRSQEPTFDGSRFEVTQQWTTSADGTRVPYFQVARKGVVLDGSNPTHIFSYGGFRNALTPAYSGSYEQLSGAYGKLWLERGGVFVLANIRGGGEFGPAWHAAALRENRPRAFEDFEAVAQDLVARGVTTPQRLGIEGRSNGGLLVLATMTRRPELYGAIICGSPLADMQRYHQMLAGASWMAEYGDPDVPADWEFLSGYSPYHRVEAGKDYPPVLFYLSTRDDRVHPGHARKMAARMMDLGYEVWYHELVEGGHGASVTNQQLARRLALSYTHLWRHLGSGGPAR